MAKKLGEILAGKYYILNEHQSGGMATIYEARILETGASVAVKRFDRDKHLPEIEAEAYRREVEALKNLKHPNIVEIIDNGEDDLGRPFLVLPWLSHDLVEHKRQAASAFNGWDDFSEQIASPLVEALAHAHANGVSHRDVKPANLLIDHDGTLKLADFGISKLKKWLAPRITLNEFASRPYSPPEPDEGSYSYSRDVWSVGVVCIWALSDARISEYDDLEPALAGLDVIADIRDILSRCISRDPKLRQESAGVLSLELARVQSKRRRLWAEKKRKACPVQLSHNCRQTVGEFIGQQDEQLIKRFVEEDINDGGTISAFIEKFGTPDERRVPNTYYVYGSQLGYQLALDNRGRNQLVLVNARQWDIHRLQTLKQAQLDTPLNLTTTPRPGNVMPFDAIRVFELALAEFEHRKLQKSSPAEDELFNTWRRLLDAKSKFERDKCSPINFISSRIEGGQLIVLVTRDEVEGVFPDQSRVIEHEKRKIHAVVCEVNGNEILLSCPHGIPENLPKSGQARLDTTASDIAIERQRTAIESVRSGSAVRSDLREVLLDPASARPPEIDPINLKITHADLDSSQKEALDHALGAKDILLVQGPPGTGKTRFIVRLIQETLARDPQARILVSSQTHVAIDNALERLARVDSGLRILRFARSGHSAVAQVSQPYIIDSQLQRWRSDVERGSNEWLQSWATARQLDPTQIGIGSLLQQVAALRRQIVSRKDAIQEIESRIDDLTRIDEDDGTTLYVKEVDALEFDAADCRVQLQSDRNYLSRLESQLQDQCHDASELLKLSEEEIAEWSGMYVGDSEDERRVVEMLMLRSEWLERFGRDPSFIGALCDRTSVVVSTCVGLTASTGDLPYDLCIIDEASKATATEAIMPMLRARKWVMVGDSMQLPPFAEEAHRDSEIISRYELDAEYATESLFERFRRLLPAECQKKLTKQYRMVPPIGKLISYCFYNKEVESHPRELDPRLMSITGRAVCWATTRYLENRRENFADSSFVNPVEVEKILDLLEELDNAVSGPDEPLSVLILSGYSAQVELLRRAVLGARGRTLHLSIECCTVDSVQGREAEVVFFSVTRSNDSARVGFLKELERVNVALSRAMELLIIVGDDEFIRRSPGAKPLKDVLDHIDFYREDCCLQAFDPPGHEKGTRK